VPPFNAEEPIMRVLRPALVLCLAAVAVAAQAGTVAVSFADNGRFADAGHAAWEQEANLRVIAHHLQSLGERHLPADQTLRIEVTGVDLAGEPRASFRRGGDLRVANGRADFPRISLRYSLESNGRVIKSGDETVTDLDYTHRIGVRRASESLPHEKYMLDRWFSTRFLAAD
jgi:hypothetical protein